MRTCFRRDPFCLFRFALLVVLVSACGSKQIAAPTPAENTEDAVTWDHVCDATTDRLQRCPREEKADGPFAKRCMTAAHDRACFETFNRNTGEFLMECIRNTPCGKGSIFENCAKDLFTKETLPNIEQQRQDKCRAHMKQCRLNFQERCIAPFLKKPLREQVWACLELPCDSIRRCTEGLLEQEGCR